MEYIYVLCLWGNNFDRGLTTPVICIEPVACNWPVKGADIPGLTSPDNWSAIFKSWWMAFSIKQKRAHQTKRTLTKADEIRGKGEQSMYDWDIKEIVSHVCQNT